MARSLPKTGGQWLAKTQSQEMTVVLGDSKSGPQALNASLNRDTPTRGRQLRMLHTVAFADANAEPSSQ